MNTVEYVASIKRHRAQTLLHSSLNTLGIYDDKIKDTSKDIVDAALQMNPKLCLESLIAASVFVAARKHQVHLGIDRISEATNHGSHNHNSWPSLVPIVRAVADNGS